jgi:hypothetical protein
LHGIVVDDEDMFGHGLVGGPWAAARLVPIWGTLAEGA